MGVLLFVRKKQQCRTDTRCCLQSNMYVLVTECESWLINYDHKRLEAE